MNSLEGDKGALKISSAGSTPGHPRRMSLSDHSPLAPDWTLAKRSSGLSLGTQRSGSPGTSDQEHGEISTVHKASPYPVTRFPAVASTPTLIGLYPLGNEVGPTIRCSSLEPAESAVIESDESDSAVARRNVTTEDGAPNAPAPLTAFKTKRQAGLFMPGAWEDQLSSDSRTSSFDGQDGALSRPTIMARRQSPLRVSVSTTSLNVASIPEAGVVGQAEAIAPLDESDPQRAEANATGPTTPVIPNTLHIGEGLAGGPQRDERGHKIDIARWQRQDPLLRSADASQSPTPGPSSLQALKKRFSRSLASLLLPKNSAATPTSKATTPIANSRSIIEFNEEDRVRRFAASTDQLNRLPVPQRGSSYRKSLVISGPYEVSVNGRPRQLSASTPDFSVLQLDGRKHRPESRPKVADWLKRQSVVEEEADAVNTAKTPVETPAAVEPLAGGAAEYFETFQPPGLDSDTSEDRRGLVPVSHTRDASAASTINLATPHVTAAATMADAQAQRSGQRRSRRKSLFGLVAFANSNAPEKQAPPEITKPDMRHSRSSSFAKLKTVFSGGRRKATTPTPIESPSLRWENVDTGSYSPTPSVERFSRPKSPFERFTFPKMNMSERRAGPDPTLPAMHDPPFQREPVVDSCTSTKRDRRRSGLRSSGDWTKLVNSAKTGLGRLASPSTANLLSQLPQEETTPVRRPSPLASPSEERLSIFEALMADSARNRGENNAQPPDYEVGDRLDQQRYDPLVLSPSVPQFDSAGRPWLAEPVRPGPRTSSRPFVATTLPATDLSEPHANRLSRLTELEEDDEAALAGFSRRTSDMREAEHAQSKPKLVLPLDLGNAFDVAAFRASTTDLLALPTPTTERRDPSEPVEGEADESPSESPSPPAHLARIGQVIQTPFFQPATLRRLSRDGSSGLVELEVTFPMPPAAAPAVSVTGEDKTTRRPVPAVHNLPGESKFAVPQSIPTLITRTRHSRHAQRQQSCVCSELELAERGQPE